jgi:hypothetical protein
MLQKFTEEIAECYAPASECRERAEQALDPDQARLSRDGKALDYVGTEL